MVLQGRKSTPRKADQLSLAMGAISRGKKKFNFGANLAGFCIHSHIYYTFSTLKNFSASVVIVGLYFVIMTFMCMMLVIVVLERLIMGQKSKKAKSFVQKPSLMAQELKSHL